MIPRFGSRGHKVSFTWSIGLVQPLTKVWFTWSQGLVHVVLMFALQFACDFFGKMVIYDISLMEYRLLLFFVKNILFVTQYVNTVCKYYFIDATFLIVCVGNIVMIT